MKRKTRKDKEKIYKEKYSDIPKDYNERLEYIIDKYNVSEKQFNDIIYRKRNMEHNLEFLDFRLVLYEIPELPWSQVKELLNEKEIYYINKYDTYNNGYNQTLGGMNTVGMPCSEKSKEFRKWYNAHRNELLSN